VTLNDLARHLPPREDLARFLASAASAARPAPSSTGTMLGMLGLGVVIGAVAASFMTPKTGAELRRQLSSRVDDVRRQIRHTADRVATPTNGGRDHRDAEHP
jgi:hypothetical protein